MLPHEISGARRIGIEVTEHQACATGGETATLWYVDPELSGD